MMYTYSAFLSLENFAFLLCFYRKSAHALDDGGAGAMDRNWHWAGFSVSASLAQSWHGYLISTWFSYSTKFGTRV